MSLSRPPFPLWGLRLLAAALGATLLLSACATSRAPANSPLSGRWRLDAKASDDVAAKVQKAIAEAQAKLRRRHRNFSGGGPQAQGGAGDEGEDQSFDSAGDLLGNGVRIGPDFRQLRMRLMQTLATPARLTIQVMGNVVTIQRDDLPARDYPAGESSTLFDEYGTARLDTRWRGAAFEVRLRYTSGAQLIERYEIDPNGALLYSRALRDPTVDKLDARSVYRRAGAPSAGQTPGP